ncbi:MAG TPA: hypothetical protein VMW18_16980 [Candidatus Binatia bacterium]|nr:hypothetical protein [Candidatus Binatia bacterium]
MMISLAEFEIALRGLLRLARFDAGFAGFFDLSKEGAKRSFRLALPLLPFYLLLLNLNAPWPPDVDLLRIGAAELIGYATMWTTFPLIMILGARLLSREDRVYGAIAVYNWISVLWIALQLPVELATYYGLDPDWGFKITVALLLFTLACEFFAFKRLINAGIEVTIALVALDFILSQFVIAPLFDAMARAPLF